MSAATGSIQNLFKLSNASHLQPPASSLQNRAHRPTSTMSSLIFFISFLLFISHLPSTLSMPRSTLVTVLSCRELCKPSAFRASCRKPPISNICRASSCECPRDTRKLRVTCGGSGCLYKSVGSSVRTQVSTFPVNLVSWSVNGVAYDRRKRRSGSCRILIKGTYRPRVKKLLTTAQMRKVLNEVLGSLSKAGTGRFMCDKQFATVVRRATNRIL